MFLPAPQESLKGAIIFGTPMVLAGQSSLPSCGTRSQPGAVRAGVRCSAPCDPGVSEENFSCLLKWPKRKPPSVTHRAPFSNRWSGQALLGFPEAAPAPPLPPGEPRRGKPRADAVAPGCPRAVPRSLLSGLIRLGPSRPRWVAAAPAGPAALCGRGGRAGRRPRARGDSSAGRLLLGRIPPRRDEPPVTLLGGRGRAPPVRAGPWLSPGMNSPSPPDPLFNSHTRTKA